MKLSSQPLSCRLCASHRTGSFASLVAPLFAGFGNEEPFIHVLLKHFSARIPEAAKFAQERRVLLLTSSKGVGLDVALAALPYEALLIERSSYFKYPPDIPLRTCSAEDLIVLKAFAGRSQDWADVERIIVRQTGRLDWNYIFEQLRPGRIKGIAHNRRRTGTSSNRV